MRINLSAFIKISTTKGIESKGRDMEIIYIWRKERTFWISDKHKVLEEGKNLAAEYRKVLEKGKN